MAILSLEYKSLANLLEGYAMTQRTETRQFLAWFLENYYHLEDNEVDDCICDDYGDKGVDGIYVHDQLNRIDLFQSHIVQTKRTLGDSLLKKLAGTISQFSSADSIRSLVRTLPKNELAKLIETQSIAKKVGDGYEIRGVFLTNVKGDAHAKAFLAITPAIALYDEVKLQETYRSIEKNPPIATPISLDVSGVSVSRLDILILRMS